MATQPGEPSSLDVKELAQNAARSAVESAGEGGSQSQQNLTQQGEPNAGQDRQEEFGQRQSEVQAGEEAGLHEQPDQQREAQDQSPEHAQRAEGEQQERRGQAEQGQLDAEEQAEQFVQEQEGTAAQFSDDEAEEVRERLEELGVNVPVSRSDLPEDAKPAYDTLLQSVMDEMANTMSQQLEAQEAMLQVQDFASKLEQEPQKVMLAMSMQNPDAFEQAVDAFERMQTDEQYADLVRRELQAEAKLAAAQRQEQAMTQQQLQRRAQQIKSRTQTAARRYGVNPEAAERVVAAAITENNGNINPSEVDNLVQSLAPRGQQRTKRQRTKSPQTQQREQQAPTQEQSGRGQGAQQTQDQQEADDSHIRSPVRSAVKKAASRVTQRQGR